MFYGAIVGDIIGSPFEFNENNYKAKDFELFSRNSYPTDDTVMTLAVASALHKSGDFERNLVRTMRTFGRLYPNAGYGARFYDWVFSKNPHPYNSCGNGSAMRVSPVAWAFDNLENVEKFAELSARVTHNHPEGIKGAKATAGAIFLARMGRSKEKIKEYIEEKYQYDLNRTCDEIRPNNYHIEICQKTVPEAIIAFLEAKDFEDAVRNAVSLGGDSDTIAAITASIAQGMWGIPEEIEKQARERLDRYLLTEIRCY